MDPSDSTLDRLACPALDKGRYEYLKVPDASRWTQTIRGQRKVEYFFALDLRQKASLLPTLLGSIIEVIRFLGRGACTLSILEGNSNDGTWEILAALVPALKKAGITYYLQASALNPAEKGGDRIGRLAALRNQVLTPLTQADARTTVIGPSASVIFLNDVAACAEDILELLHQRRALGADMVCGMDWTYPDETATFYDVWVARSMAGGSFFDIPSNGAWAHALDLFWDDERAKARFKKHRPLQVFGCWNGGAVFAASAVVGENALRFRTFSGGEAVQGEPMLFCKDLWMRGLGRIAVVPSVNLAYFVEEGRKVKGLKGYVEELVRGEDGKANKLDWVAKPPAKIKTWSTYDKQEWREWDES